MADSSLGLRPLGSVLGAALSAIRNAHRVQRSTNYVVADTRKILHAAAANEHNRVLLQVVADAGNVGRYLDPVRQAHTRNLTKSRVRFLWRLGDRKSTRLNSSHANIS